MKEIINMSDNNGNSVLHISAFNGDFRIVKKLVFYGGEKKSKYPRSITSRFIKG